MAAAPKLSAFGQMAEDAFTSRDVMIGQPKRRRDVIASLEASGMTTDEFRLVMRWWDRQTSFETAGVLRDVLADELNWRDVVACERPRRDREEAEQVDFSHYPNMPAQAYEPNPLIRELKRQPPFTERDAVDAYRAGFGRNLLGLAHWLHWTDADEVMAAQRDGIEPAGLERVKAALSAAGIELAPEMPRGKKSRQKAKEAAQNERAEERHKKAAALFRVRAGQGRPGDEDLIAGWDPQSEVQA